MTSLKLEFSGGSELLVGGKEHVVTVPLKGDELTVKSLLSWIRHNLVKDRPEFLIQGDTVRPGILVLVNECDWELLKEVDTQLKDGDVVTFISTLHGG